jgi:hypothetical protein
MEDERVSWIMHNSYIHTIVNWMRNSLYNAYYTIVEISSHAPLQNCLKNGYYIPAIHAALYYVTGDAVISTAVAMKMYPANYFYWFGEQYDFRIPKRYNWIKQFVRFTDTGYLACYIYIINPDFFPINYNIQYSITFGYWIGKLSGISPHIDLLEDPDLNRTFELSWANANHGIHLVLLTYRMLTDDVCYDHFTLQHLTWTYYWAYIWFIAIYLPWRIITGDCVYGVFSSDTPWSKKIMFVCLMHGIVALGNATGYLLR